MTQRIRPGENAIAHPVVSELRLDARGGHDRTSGSDSYKITEPTVNRGMRHYDADPEFSSQPYVIEPNDTSYNNFSLRQRLANLSILHDAQSWLSWLNGSYTGLSDAEHQSAETNLRAILERYSVVDGPLTVNEEGY